MAYLNKKTFAKALGISMPTLLRWERHVAYPVTPMKAQWGRNVLYDELDVVTINAWRDSLRLPEGVAPSYEEDDLP